MSIIRPARSTDAAGIALVHVAAWRSAYPGMLPDSTLTHLNPDQHELYYSRLIRTGHSVHVAEEGGEVIGFVTAARLAEPVIAEGEIETLYVLDDYREQGIGRRLMQAAAQALADAGCASVFVWVLSQNPSRWFYERMGGVRSVQGHVRVGGEMQPQTAFVWDPIEHLLGEQG